MDKRNMQLVIEIPSIGLGDHLFYSPIPKLAKENTYKQVFISDVSQCRNREFMDLVWKSNPYIDGYTMARGSIFPCISKLRNDNDENIIQLYAKEFTFNNSPRNPICYWTPNTHRYDGLNIYDSGSHSTWVTNNITISDVLNYFKNNNITIDYQLMHRYSKLILPDVPVLSSLSSIEFATLLYNAKSYYSMWSGGSNLRAAFGKTANVFYKLPWPHDHKVFIVDNNNYIDLGEL